TTEYWDTLRPVPLEEDEVRSYEFKDSMYIVEKAKADTMKIRKTSDMSVMGFLLRSPTFKTKKHRVSVNSILSSVNYNTVEGVNLTLALNWRYMIDSGKTLTT